MHDNHYTLRRPATVWINGKSVQETFPKGTVVIKRGGSPVCSDEVYVSTQDELNWFYIHKDLLARVVPKQSTEEHTGDELMSVIERGDSVKIIDPHSSYYGKIGKVRDLGFTKNKTLVQLVPEYTTIWFPDHLLERVDPEGEEATEFKINDTVQMKKTDSRLFGEIGKVMEVNGPGPFKDRALVRFLEGDINQSTIWVNLEHLERVDPEGEEVTEEHTGGSSSYYQTLVKHPTEEGREPYMAECNDIIEALKMNFAEANSFKAIWRSAASRLGKKKKGNNRVYDAEKVCFYGPRMLVIAKSEEEDQ